MNKLTISDDFFDRITFREYDYTHFGTTQITAEQRIASSSALPHYDVMCSSAINHVQYAQYQTYRTLHDIVYGEIVHRLHEIHAQVQRLPISPMYYIEHQTAIDAIQQLRDGISALTPEEFSRRMCALPTPTNTKVTP